MIALLTSVLALPGFLRSAAADMDEGVLLVYPALIRAGRVPYRDFRFLYGPAQPWLLSLLPSALLAERLVGVLARFVVALGVYLLVRERAPDLAIAAAALSLTVALTGGVGGFAWLLGLACVTMSLVCVDRKAFLLAGVLGGLAVAFRFDLAPSAIVVGLTFDWRRLRAFALGFGVVGVGLLVQAFQPGLAAVWQSTVVDELHQAPGRRLPLPSGSVLLFAVVTIASAVLLLASARDARQRRIAIAGVLMLGQMFQRMDKYHVAYVAAFLIPLALSALSSIDRRAVFLFVLMALVVAPLNLISDNARTTLGLRQGDGEAVSFRGKTWIAPRGGAHALRRLLVIVDGLPGCSVFVGPSDLRFAEYNDSYLYALLMYRFEPATPFIELNPGIANVAGSGWREDLESADVVILDRSLNPDPATRVAGPDIRSVLRDRTRVPAPKPFEIYSRTATRRCLPARRR